MTCLWTAILSGDSTVQPTLWLKGFAVATVATETAATVHNALRLALMVLLMETNKLSRCYFSPSKPVFAAFLFTSIVTQSSENCGIILH